MKPLRRLFAVATLAVASVAIGFLGFNVVQNVQFARAQDRVSTTREQLATVQDLSSVFRRVGEVVEPSVVSINVRKEIKGMHHGMPFDDDFLRRFFPDQDNDGEPDVPPGFNDNGGTMEEIGTGSGVIMEASDGTGYILTNNHVAGGATELDVTLNDGRVIKNAKVVGTDPKTDLAVVQIQADRLIPAKWGNSDSLTKGDWILAFGSPFGYVGSMTHGIVSALNRTNLGILGDQGYENFIQVDAPINPGNSGGPLVNIHGEVVGINTAIASRNGGFQGIGFAIPSNLAKFVYTSLRQQGKVTRGWLGVSIADVSDPQVGPVARSFGYEGSTGVLVQQVFPNTPAYGKLQAGDVITALNGKPLESLTQLRNGVAATAPGSEVTLRVFREGKTTDVPVKIGSQPSDLAAVGRGQGGPQGQGPAGHASAGALGLRLNDITDQLAQRFDLGNTKGAVVTGVERNSIAARAGIRPGDVITRVGNRSVSSAAEAAEALDKADLKKGVPIYIVGREGSRFVYLQKGE